MSQLSRSTVAHQSQVDVRHVEPAGQIPVPAVAQFWVHRPPLAAGGKSYIATNLAEFGSCAL